jgi:hypothetical protein
MTCGEADQAYGLARRNFCLSDLALASGAANYKHSLQTRRRSINRQGHGYGIGQRFAGGHQGALMSIKSVYSRAVRRELGYFPVWQPGLEILPGDVGTIDGSGIFHKETDLAKYTRGKLKCGMTNPGALQSRKFYSQAGTEVSFGAEAAGIVKGTINFTSADAVFFEAACQTQSIDDVSRVLTYMSSDRTSWNRQYFVVTEVEISTRHLVLIAHESSPHGSIEFSGPVQLARNLVLSDPKVSITRRDNLGYEVTGSGSLMLRLYGFSWLSKKPAITQSITDNGDSGEADVVELSAYDDEAIKEIVLNAKW